ncbi:MAG: calcium-binding protein [Pseudomonadota bacterium]
MAIFTAIGEGVVRRPQDYGAFPDDGIDDTDAFKAMLSDGGEIEIPAGVWDFDSTVHVLMTESVDVTAHPDAVFRSNGIDGDLFRFRVNAQSPDNLTLTWDGGTFDITDQLNSQVVPYVRLGAPIGEQGSSATADALSIRGIFQDRAADTSTVKIANVSISNVSVVASAPGEDWTTAGGDSGIFIQAGAATVEDSYFRGIRDSAIYLSADGLFNDVGGNYTVRNVTVEGSLMGISVKRGADDIVIEGNTIIDTAVGVVVDETRAAPEGGALSSDIVIEGNSFARAWLAIRLGDAENVTVSGNTFTDLQPFDYISHIAPTVLHFWGDTQVTNIVFENNTFGEGVEFPDVLGRPKTISQTNGTDQDDVLVSGENSHVLNGGAGNDTVSYEHSDGRVVVSLHSGVGLRGDAAGDTLTDIENLVGSEFNDILSGDNDRQVGNTIMGLGGNDWIRGNGGDDTVDGGTGDDRLTGGRGSDTFVFQDGHGVDVVTDFTTDDPNEVIDLTAISAITDFEDLRDNHVAQVGADVIINTGESQIILTDTSLETVLDSSNFIF